MENNNGNWAELIQRRQADYFELHVRDGMPPLKFQRAEMLDLIEEDYLPEDLLQPILKKFFGKNKPLAGEVQAAGEELVVERAKEFMEIGKRMAVHLSFEPKITLSPDIERDDSGKIIALPWKGFTQAERTSIIEGMYRNLAEGVDGLKPFRAKPKDGDSAPDGDNVSTEGRPGNGPEVDPEGMELQPRNIPETREHGV